MPTLGADGAPCPKCGSPLASDQRYCLQCGARRGEARLPYERYLTPPGAPNQAPPVAPPPANDVSPLGAILGVALLGGMLLIGVLLGRGEDDATPQATPAITTTAAATTTPGSATAGSVTSEWPDGQDGFTIELGTLPKAGTTPADVESTKADLEGDGASGVAVLDSDLYPSLPTGNYVIYSGVFQTEAEAQAALTALQPSFPDAAVIEVSQKGSGGGGGGGVKDPTSAVPQGTAPPSGSGATTDLQDALDEATQNSAAAPPSAEPTPDGDDLPAITDAAPEEERGPRVSQSGSSSEAAERAGSR